MNEPALCPPVVHLLVLEDFPCSVSNLLAEIEKSEQDRAQAMQAAEARELFVYGRTLLRRSLRTLFGLDHAEILISAHGKPRLANSDIRFNLSHTSGGLALALCEGVELGIDVEPLKRRVNVEPLAERSFTASEREWMDQSETRRRFLTLWTLKEAFMKARGLGFRLDPRSFGFAIDGRGPRLVSTRDDLAEPWLFHSDTVGHLQMALAAGGARVAQGVELRCYRGESLFP